MYNLEDEVTAYYFKLKTGGSAIANTEDGIIEFHFTDDIYNLTKEDKFYYTAPLECYEDVGYKKVRHRFDKKARRKDSLIVKNKASNDSDAFTRRVTADEFIKYTKVEKGGITGKTEPYSSNIGNIYGIIATALGSSGYGDDNGHWVVGTGYWTVKITANNASTTARYVQMNDGWGNRGVYINLLHVNGIIYIE